MNTVRLSVLVAVASTLVACGGAKLAPTKEAAAQALFQSSEYTRPPSNTASGADLSMEVRTDCRHGGRAAIKYDLSDWTNPGTPSPEVGELAYDVRFENCNNDGATSMNGTLSTVFRIDGTDPMSPEVVLTLRGRIDFSGEVSDFVDADVTERISLSQLGATGGSVSVTLSGHITTSSGRFEYDQSETISFTAGDFVTADEHTTDAP
jgi:hypothetical protein